MPIEGELVVRVECQGRRVTSATARCQRPRMASRLFPGRPARDAVPLARALYAICGRSQSAAAEAAIEAIRGERVPEASARARECRIAAETLVEHAWRLLVDAPRLAGRDPATSALASARRVLAPYLEARDASLPEPGALLDWSRGALLGRNPADFLAIETLDELLEWARWSSTPAAAACGVLLADDPTLGASDVALMPAAGPWVAETLATAIDRNAAFDECPDIDGAARETGPLARTSVHPLVAAAVAAWGHAYGPRLVARLVECATLLDSLSRPGSRAARRACGATATETGAGISWVETARGLLVHRVRLEGERIAAYRIVAPTEWNFHPEGAFAHGARELDAAEAGALEANVRRLVASLDPCVGVRYEAVHA